MSERDFIYWLSGLLETNETNELTKKQVQSVKDHLALVLCKVTPDLSPPALPKQVSEPKTTIRPPAFPSGGRLC